MQQLLRLASSMAMMKAEAARWGGWGEMRTGHHYWGTKHHLLRTEARCQSQDGGLKRPSLPAFRIRALGMHSAYPPRLRQLSPALEHSLSFLPSKAYSPRASTGTATCPSIHHSPRKYRLSPAQSTQERRGRSCQTWFVF